MLCEPEGRPVTASSRLGTDGHRAHTPLHSLRATVHRPGSRSGTCASVWSVKFRDNCTLSSAASIRLISCQKLCQKRECGPLQASEMIEKLCHVSCHPPSIDNGARHQIVTCVEPAPGS